MLTKERLCSRHLSQERATQDRERGSAHARGYGAKWRRVRGAYLARHPLCRTCETAGRTTPATVVDHVTPHRGDQALFWDSGNWQPLCKRCHDVKTATEDGGFGNVPA